MVGPIRCLDLDADVIALLRDRGDLVAPAHVDLGQLADTVDQESLGVILLQVDEGRHLVTRLGQQVEAIDLRVAVEHLADLPDDAFPQHAVGDAEAVPGFERALGEADGAAALADAIHVVEQDDGMPALREPDGERQSDGPAADDDHRVMRRSRARLVGAFAVAELELLAGGGFAHGCPAGVPAAFHALPC